MSIVRGDNAERNGTHLLAEVLRKRDEDDTRELGDLDPDTGSGPGCRR